MFVFEEVREAGKPEFGFPSFALSCWGFKQQLTHSEEHRQLSVWRQMAPGRFPYTRLLITGDPRGEEVVSVPSTESNRTMLPSSPLRKNTTLKLFSEEAKLLPYKHNLII